MTTISPILDQHGRNVVRESAAVPRRDAGDERWTVRRWESAETNRLNSAHWANAHGQPINQDLADDRETLVARAQYEAANNPLVAGMINTYATDLLGPRGPQLQIESNNDRFNRAAEEVVDEWGETADFLGELCLTDLLRQSVGLWFTHGESLFRERTQAESVFPVSLRLQAIEPRLVSTPIARSGEQNIGLGITFGPAGEKLEYHIARVTRWGPYETQLGTEHDTVSADRIYHLYEQLEPGQLRGAPWLSTSLNAIADLRDYDVQVLDAARAAADTGVYFYTEHQDAPFYLVNESTEIERRTASNCPPGWKPMQIAAEQPMPNYIDFREERMLDIGRPISMPLMLVRLSSRDHNFSSARFDGQNYQRALMARRCWIERRALNRLTRSVLREATLAARAGNRDLDPVLAQPPRRIKLIWQWTPTPHVDPSKEAKAIEIKRKILQLSMTDALAQEGKTLDQHIAQLGREFREFERAGLLPFLVASLVGNMNQPADSSESAADNSDDASAGGDDNDVDEAASARASQLLEACLAN